MGRRRVDFRLHSKELFIWYPKWIGRDDKKVTARGYTNKRVLSQRSGVNYDNLVRVFTREGKHYYENADGVIIRLYVSEITKGGQSVARKGKGGMENFVRYIMKERGVY